jgi:hypothetical protein
MERATFAPRRSRSRPYRKNDQAWIGQKNGAVVRKLLGYRRFEGIASAQARESQFGWATTELQFPPPGTGSVNSSEFAPGPAGAAGQVIASVEGAQKIEFATLLENRAIGTIGEMIFNFLKPQC